MKLEPEAEVALADQAWEPGKGKPPLPSSYSCSNFPHQSGKLDNSLHFMGVYLTSQVHFYGC